MSWVSTGVTLGQTNMSWVGIPWVGLAYWASEGWTGSYCFLVRSNCPQLLVSDSFEGERLLVLPCKEDSTPARSCSNQWSSRLPISEVGPTSALWMPGGKPIQRKSTSTGLRNTHPKKEHQVRVDCMTTFIRRQSPSQDQKEDESTEQEARKEY